MSSWLKRLANGKYEQYITTPRAWAGVAAALFVLSIPVLLLFEHLAGHDAFELLHDFSRRYEKWNIDEIFVALMLLGVVASGLLIARSVGFERELKLRGRTDDLFAAALNSMQHGLSMFDADGRLVIFNAPYVAIHGLPPELVRPGTTFTDILNYQQSRGQLNNTSPEEINLKVKAVLDSKESATWFRNFPDGRLIRTVVTPTEGGGWVSTHEDITGQTEQETRLVYLARYDALTGLPNRSQIQEWLNNRMRALDSDGQFAVLCLDLNRFRPFNDAFGRAAGDHILRKIAERLAGCISDADIVGRVAGDRFVIGQAWPAQPDAAVTLAGEVLEALNTPFTLSGHQVQISASIGIAVAPTDGVDPDTLLKNADLALRLAKESARGAYRLFQPDMDEEMRTRQQIELDLPNALPKGELRLAYQPIFSLKADEVCGFEALLRWDHPEKGAISPAEFIPVAEETELIIPIGEWVLRQACTDAASWPGSTIVSLNVSPVQFRSPNLVYRVVGALSASGLEPHRLELEITETAFLENNTNTIATLHQLRSVGVRIVMDDFGVGYSSLSYFQTFPFDKVKVDQSFVKGLGEQTSSLAILHAVAELGSNLTIATTAEGVETEEQLAQIRASGIDQVQGYLLGRPMPPEDAAKLLLPRSIDAEGHDAANASAAVS